MNRPGERILQFDASADHGFFTGKRVYVIDPCCAGIDGRTKRAFNNTCCSKIDRDRRIAALSGRLVRAAANVASGEVMVPSGIIAGWRDVEFSGTSAPVPHTTNNTIAKILRGPTIPPCED